MLELEIRRPSSLLSVELKREITEEQAAAIRTLLDSKTITVEVPQLTPQECGSIVITAAEGGIGYWSQIETYKYTRWMPNDTSGEVGSEDTMLDVPDDFVFYTIHEMTDAEDGYKEEGIDITPALIRRGFEAAFKAPKDKGGWMAQNLIANTAREDWTGEIDSEGADMIVQFGVFGELKWG